MRAQVFAVLRFVIWEAGGRGVGRSRNRYVETPLAFHEIELAVGYTVRSWLAKERCLRRDTDHAMRLPCRFRSDEMRDTVFHCISPKPTPRYSRKPIPTVTAIFRADHAFLCPDQPPIGKNYIFTRGTIPLWLQQPSSRPYRWQLRPKLFLHKNGASGWTKHNCFCFCFGWPVEPPPPGVGQLCRTLGKSRPAASLGRPGGPEWAQFVLIPYSLAGTALRPSWKGDTKRVPAILGSVGGPCRDRVWPNTRPARRLKDRPRGLPDLLRSGSNTYFLY